MPTKRSAVAGWLISGLLAAWLASPVAVSASSTTHTPGPVGPHSGAFSPITSPRTGVRSPAINTATPPPCDGKFDAVTSPSATGQNVLLSTVAISANDVWAVGNSTNASGFDRTLAEHWNGAAWTIVPTPNVGTRHNDLWSVTALSSTNVWAVGFYETDSLGHSSTLALHWNGTSWIVSATPNPSSYSFLFAVTPVGVGSLFAVGTYFNFTTGKFNNLIEGWDGAVWAPEPSVNAGGNTATNQLFAISAWNGNDVWAVGSSQAAVGMPIRSVAEHFDGIGWSVITTPNLSGPTADSEILGVNALEAGHAVGVGYGGFVSGSAPRQGAAWDLVATGTSTASFELGPGTGDNVLTAVARSGAGAWAVGYSRTSATSARQTLTIPATWDSAGHSLTWGSFGASDSPSIVNNALFAVAALSPHVFWATGYETSGTTDKTLTERYCGVHFGMIAPATATVGSPFAVTVTVANANSTTATGYLGTVHFTSSDSLAALPTDYTFIPGDAGTYVFNGVILNTPYSQTIVVSDAVTPIVTSSATIGVVCSGACQGPGATPASRAATNQSPSVPPPGTRVPIGAAPRKAQVGVQAVPQRTTNKTGLVHAGDGVLVSQASIGSPQATGLAWNAGLVSPLWLIVFALQALRR